MPDVHLNATDAMELAKLLTFLNDWLDRDSQQQPATSLASFPGNDADNITALRRDLAPFVFLLGGDDGESLFGDHPR